MECFKRVIKCDDKEEFSKLIGIINHSVIVYPGTSVKAEEIIVNQENCSFEFYNVYGVYLDALYYNDDSKIILTLIADDNLARIDFSELDHPKNQPGSVHLRFSYGIKSKTLDNINHEILETFFQNTEKQQ